MARHDLCPGQASQGRDVRQPHRQPGTVGRCQRPLIKHQVPGKQHTSLLVENSQIRAGMPTQAQQAQIVIPKTFHAGCQRLSRQHHFGATHPVADHPVHILRHGIALLVQQLAGAGQGADWHVGEGLITQHMVRVMTGQQDLDHRLVGGGGNGLAHRFAVTPGRPGVDHHHTALSDDKRGVDDVAAVGLGEIIGAAFQ
ncbi:hypothetical protein D9M69_570290 [compost metagenome]